MRDPDGFLRLVDRAKDMVISGGFNVYPRAVEDVLEAHPGVASACVFGVPDVRWGEIVVAVVVLRDDTTTVADLIAYVRERKGPVQTPKRIEIVDMIPLTGVGKPDKKQLRQIYAPAVGQSNRRKTMTVAIPSEGMPAALRGYLRALMAERSIPGLQVAVIRDGRIAALDALGVANLEHQLPVTDTSIFSVNSMAKAFTGVAVMQLVEAGMLDLAAPISPVSR